MDNLQKDKIKEVIKNSLPLLGLLVAVYLVVLIITQVKGWGMLGKDSIQPTITVSGMGEVYATPDIAELRATIVGESKDRSDSAAKQAEVKDKVLAVMSEFSIAEKDYKTEYIYTNPKYEWQRAQIYCVTYPCPQPEGKQVITGYTTEEVLVVKVRNIDDAGKIYDAIVKAGAQNVSGPNMMIDDEDALRAQARKMAIDDAKMQASQLAKDLGVRKLRIVSFNEGGNYPMPMYAGGDMMVRSKAESAPSTNISTGQNKITSNVTIVYEIR